eukprot:TRINITY_DN3840_c0_g1_i1.p1 TRINITY_DN3840_c0_g1~~TRINITY_DN3840_c0_g1_i1.p1  ORF type:complete len:2470 (+),score=543.28 TRINITY_DN3840_c0_g1_i1:39-7448(+)
MATGLSSYVPRIVIERYTKKSNNTVQPPEENRYLAAVLFADISGFTPLTEKMTALGPKGIDLMSMALNNFFDKVINIIHEHGGEIIKFAGDALLAIWPCDISDTTQVSENIILACESALKMQEQLKGYTAEGCLLTLHSGIGAGGISGLHVGGVNGRLEYLIAGEPLEQVSECEKRAQPGQVYISHDAWQNVRLTHPDAIVVGMLKSTFSGKKMRKKKMSDIDTAYLLMEVNAPVRSNSSKDDIILPEKILKEKIAMYCPSAVTKRLTAPQEEGFMAEMREISVIFVNLQFIYVKGKKNLNLLQNACKEMQNDIFRFGGEIRQFLVDDKGSVLIGVFGLPPESHEDDSLRSVLSAISLQRSLNELGIGSRIGITTGTAFCGDVGNKSRREFAMVGDIVNLSARLMAACEWGSILCEKNTFSSCSTVSTDIIFEALKPINVKGKSHPIQIYRPTKVDKSTSSTQTGLGGLSSVVETSQSSIPSSQEAASALTRIISSPALPPSVQLASPSLERIRARQVMEKSLKRKNGPKRLVGRVTEMAAVEYVLQSILLHSFGAETISLQNSTKSNDATPTSPTSETSNIQVAPINLPTTDSRSVALTSSSQGKDGPIISLSETNAESNSTSSLESPRSSAAKQSARKDKKSSLDLPQDVKRQRRKSNDDRIRRHKKAESESVSSKKDVSGSKTPEETIKSPLRKSAKETSTITVDHTSVVETKQTLISSATIHTLTNLPKTVRESSTPPSSPRLKVSNGHRRARSNSNATSSSSSADIIVVDRKVATNKRAHQSVPRPKSVLVSNIKDLSELNLSPLSHSSTLKKSNESKFKNTMSEGTFRNSNAEHNVSEAEELESKIKGRSILKAYTKNNLSPKLAEKYSKINSGILVIDAEAGMGKSTILHQALTRSSELLHNFVCLKGYADSIDQSPYYAWRAVLAALFNLNPTDDEDARDHIIEYVTTFTPQYLPHIHLLNSIFPLDFPNDTEKKEGDGPSFKKATVTLSKFITALLKSSSKKYRLIIFDNAHWLDSLSWGMIGEVVSQLSNTLIILSTRPMIPLPIEIHQILSTTFTQVLKIKELSEKDILELIKKQMRVTQLPKLLEREIISKMQDRRPLMALEVAEIITNSGMVEVSPLGICTMSGKGSDLLESKNFMVPTTLKLGFTARIDRLSPTQKNVVKIASVVGNSFPLALLFHLTTLNHTSSASNAVSETESNSNENNSTSNANDSNNSNQLDLMTILNDLEDLEIFELLQEGSDAISYKFKNPMARDIVYDLVIYSQKKKLHQSIYQWYKANHKDLTTYYPLLGYHAANGENYKKAAFYYTKAAKQALQTNSGKEAVKYLELVVEYSSKDKDSDKDSQSRSLHTESLLGQAYFNIGYLERARKHFTAALTCAGDSQIGNMNTNNNIYQDLSSLAGLLSSTTKFGTKKTKSRLKLEIENITKSDKSSEHLDAAISTQLDELAVTCNEGDVAKAKLLLTSIPSARINTPSPTWEKTALFLASKGGHENIVKEILNKKGVDTNIQDDVGNTALHAASMNGHANIVSILLSSGLCDINIKNYRGRGLTAMEESSESTIPVWQTFYHGGGVKALEIKGYSVVAKRRKSNDAISHSDSIIRSDYKQKLKLSDLLEISKEMKENKVSNTSNSNSSGGSSSSISGTITGLDIIQWLVDSQKVTEKEATYIGKNLLKEGLISRHHDFTHHPTVAGTFSKSGIYTMYSGGENPSSPPTASASFLQSLIPSAQGGTELKIKKKFAFFKKTGSPKIEKQIIQQENSAKSLQMVTNSIEIYGYMSRVYYYLGMQEHLKYVCVRPLSVCSENISTPKIARLIGDLAVSSILPVSTMINMPATQVLSLPSISGSSSLNTLPVVSNNFSASFNLIQQYNALAKNFCSNQAEVHRLLNMSIAFSGFGFWKNADSYLQTAIDIASSSEDKRLEDECKLCKIVNGYFQGQLNEDNISLIEEIKTSSRSDIQTQQMALNYHALYLYGLGKLQQLYDMSKEIQDNSSKEDLDPYTLFTSRAILVMVEILQHKEQKALQSAISLLNWFTSLSLTNTQPPTVYFILPVLDILPKAAIFWLTKGQQQSSSRNVQELNTNAASLFQRSLLIIQNYSEIYPIAEPYYLFIQGLALIDQPRANHQIETLWEKASGSAEKLGMKQIESVINYWWGHTTYVADSNATIKRRAKHASFYEEYEKEINGNSEVLRNELIILPNGREIFEESRRGNLIYVSNLISVYKQDVNAVGRFGRTPVVWAAMMGHHRVVAMLCEYGANVNARDELHWTSLHWACNNNHLDVVKILLSYHADKTLKTSEGKLAQHLTTNDTIRNLVMCDIDDEEEAVGFWPWVEMGDLEYLKRALAQSKNWLEKRNVYGCTPLLVASMMGHTHVVKYLLKHDANINVRDTEGWTPLMWACNNGFLTIVKLLLGFGADCNITDKKQRSALALSSSEKIEQIIKKHMSKSILPSSISSPTN